MRVWKFRGKGKKVKDVIAIRNLNGNIRCDNGEIIKELVMSGVGIALKSSCDAENEIKSGGLVVLLEDYEIINETEFYAVSILQAKMFLRKRRHSLIFLGEAKRKRVDVLSLYVRP